MEDENEPDVSITFFSYNFYTLIIFQSLLITIFFTANHHRYNRGASTKWRSWPMPGKAWQGGPPKSAHKLKLQGIVVISKYI